LFVKSRRICRLKGSSDINRFVDTISIGKSRHPFLTAVGLSAAGLAIVFALNALGNIGAFRIFYLLPIWLAVRIDGRRAGLAMVVVTCAAMFGEDLRRTAYASTDAALVESGFRLISFSGIAWIIGGVESRLANTERLAMRDPLTGLSNRRALTEFWHSRIVRESASSSYVVVMIDCDGFKNLNDRHGHEAGDRVLQILGQVLESETRRNDLVARVGGDEFVLVLKETDPLEARRVLQRIQSYFESQVLNAGYVCSLSVGYAPVQADDQSIEEILSRADREMYRQKEFKRATAFLN
jgi:diguanylate cyclase (GGDEF)-like protein